MAFVPFVAVSTQAAGLRKCGLCAWRGERSVIGKWSSFRGETLPLHLPPRQSRKSWDVEQFRVVPTALLSGGGFLGVGTSEVVVILLVGWLLLGPEKLFALAKDTGKILGELRRTADKAKEQFNEAVELDLLEAEMRNNKNMKTSEASENGVGSPNEAYKDDGEPEPLKTAELVNELSSPGSQTMQAIGLEEKSEEGVRSDEVVSTAFLDQLKRVADPEQSSPSEIPDLEIGEEEEVKRLEKQYLEAKQRLERRKIEEQDRPEQNENKSVVGER
ncbi:Sec-independent protein translocase protein TatA/B/E [Gracilaria domingensis]|nr:Sec-independent protein translocase protein TatA/B/E [Gracilaria domingensis]